MIVTTKRMIVTTKRMIVTTKRMNVTTKRMIVTTKRMIVTTKRIIVTTKHYSIYIIYKRNTRALTNMSSLTHRNVSKCGFCRRQPTLISKGTITRNKGLTLVYVSMFPLSKPDGSLLTCCCLCIKSYCFFNKIKIQFDSMGLGSSYRFSV